MAVPFAPASRRAPTAPPPPHHHRRPGPASRRLLLLPAHTGTSRRFRPRPHRHVSAWGKQPGPREGRGDRRTRMSEIGGAGRALLRLRCSLGSAERCRFRSGSWAGLGARRGADSPGTHPRPAPPAALPLSVPQDYRSRLPLRYSRRFLGGAVQPSLSHWPLWERTSPRTNRYRAAAGRPAEVAQ